MTQTLSRTGSKSLRSNKNLLCNSASPYASSEQLSKRALLERESRSKCKSDHADTYQPCSCSL